MVDKNHGLSDTEERESFHTGMVREPNLMRGRYDLISPIALAQVASIAGGYCEIPPIALELLAIHYERGALKYAPRNWELGGYVSRYLNSAIRHAQNYLKGCRKEDHITACAWNCFSIMHTEEMVERGVLPKDLLDLPDYKPTFSDYGEGKKFAELDKLDMIIYCLNSYLEGVRNTALLATAAFFCFKLNEQVKRDEKVFDPQSIKDKAILKDCILHILRNPFGWSEESVRTARLIAANQIEKSIFAEDMSII